jgi:predicted RNA binding protein YcfA (HicA-like mRNA interferase family)
MKYCEMARLLKRYGYRFDRHCRGSHELWRHINGSTILVSRSGLHDRARKNWLQNLKATAQAAA